MRPDREIYQVFSFNYWTIAETRTVKWNTMLGGPIGHPSHTIPYYNIILYYNIIKRHACLVVKLRAADFFL